MKDTKKRASTARGVDQAEDVQAKGQPAGTFAPRSAGSGTFRKSRRTANR